jgi:hypothetical protein
VQKYSDKQVWSNNKILYLLKPAWIQSTLLLVVEVVVVVVVVVLILHISPLPFNVFTHQILVSTFYALYHVPVHYFSFLISLSLIRSVFL